jgi:ElaB/YqjD/DUF883 family membrane-anchored ribosome-binding protein
LLFRIFSASSDVEQEYKRVGREGPQILSGLSRLMATPPRALATSYKSLTGAVKQETASTFGAVTDELKGMAGQFGSLMKNGGQLSRGDGVARVLSSETSNFKADISGFNNKARGIIQTMQEAMKQVNVTLESDTQKTKTAADVIVAEAINKANAILEEFIQQHIAVDRENRTKQLTSTYKSVEDQINKVLSSTGMKAEKLLDNVNKDLADAIKLEDEANNEQAK